MKMWRRLVLFVLAFVPVAFAVAALDSGLQHAWTAETWRHVGFKTLRFVAGAAVAIWALLLMKDLDAG
jgi:hypothetical protein